MTYNTKQKKLLLNYLKENKDKCLDIKGINNYFKDSNIKIGLTTIYRYLNDLVDNNIIKKYNNDLNGYLYSYTCDNCHNHYHLKCLECNEIIHLNCEIFNDLNKHITREHNFMLDNSKLVLYGLCEKCRDKNEKKD